MLKRLLPILATIAVLGAVIYLGRMALDQLRRENTYTLRLSQIECVPPPGLNRRDFLDEVQYSSNLPSELSLLDEGLPRRLARAFRKHTWVQKVDRVEVIPPKSVRIELTYRAAVLAVHLEGEMRAVDKNGILLPRAARTNGLPIYSGTPSPPMGSAGTVWADPELLRAARKAGGS